MNQCTICGSELNMIPAGVSRTTGKAYNAFYACPNKCKPATPPARPTVAKVRDFDAEARGKVRHGLVCAMIQAGWKKEDIKAQIKGYEDFILGVKKPMPVPVQPAHAPVEEDGVDLNDIPF